jgi:hypothetical protein
VLYAQLPKLEPLMRRLRARHKMMTKLLSKSTKFRISPHNDPDNAVVACPRGVIQFQC